MSRRPPPDDLLDWLDNYLQPEGKSLCEARDRLEYLQDKVHYLISMCNSQWYTGDRDTFNTAHEDLARTRRMMRMYEDHIQKLVEEARKLGGHPIKVDNDDGFLF